MSPYFSFIGMPPEAALATLLLAAFVLTRAKMPLHSFSFEALACCACAFFPLLTTYLLRWMGVVLVSTEAPQGMWLWVVRIGGGIFFGHWALRRISKSQVSLKGLLLANVSLSVCYLTAICVLIGLIYGAAHKAKVLDM